MKRATITEKYVNYLFYHLFAQIRQGETVRFDGKDAVKNK